MDLVTFNWGGLESGFLAKIRGEKKLKYLGMVFGFFMKKHIKIERREWIFDFFLYGLLTFPVAFWLKYFLPKHTEVIGTQKMMRLECRNSM